MSNSTTDIGKALEATTSSFETAFWINASLFGLQLAAFTLLRPTLPLIYQPRSLLPLESKRQDPLIGNILKWPLAIFKADYTKVKRTNGMDAYFFLRFLRMAIRIFLPIWFFSWAILLPITSVHTSVDNATGLDRFVFGNVANDKQSRYAAHVILAWAFTGWICYNIKYEMRHFVQSRQHHLVSKSHANLARSRTLLITGIPSRYLTERQLFSVFSYLPGGVHKVWLNRDLKDLPDVYKERQKALRKLEGAESQLLSIATKMHQEQLVSSTKTQAQDQVRRGKARAAAEKAQQPQSTDSITPLSPVSQHTDLDLERAMSHAEILVPKDRRPRHRLAAASWLPALPLVGKSVDSIDWARAEVTRCNEILAAGRVQWREDIATDENSADDFYKPLNSAFILFNQQIAVHLALQSVIHHDSYRMAGKYIEVAQQDVIWSSLSLNPYEQQLRAALSYAVTIGLIIVWAFPTAFVGAVSNIKGLCDEYHWLAWICRLPERVQDILTGVLPPALLTLLTILPPILLRLLARSEGVPTRSGIELSVMNRFFGFLVINSFLVVTLSSGIIASIPDLANNPGSIPGLLAQNLPKASNFFLTYVVLQGLTGSASGFLQIVQLLLYYLQVVLSGGTPRSVYNTKFGVRSLSMGEVFPRVTLIVVVAIAYSIISPIINGLVCMTLFLLYMLYKYLFLWCMQQPPSQDTGGLFFPKAINHVFVGMYIEQVCLAALFFLARDVKNDPSAIPQGAMTIVLIGFTAFFHWTITDSYGPLVKALPLTLADKTYGIAHDDVAEGGEPVAPTQAKLKDTMPVPKGESSNVEGYELQPRGTRSDELGTRPDGMQRRRNTHENDIGEEGTMASVLEESQADPDEDNGPTDFTHPAVANHRQTVWLPVDTLGLVHQEAAAIRALKIDVSTDGAKMNEKGHIDISSAPPDLLDDDY